MEFSKVIINLWSWSLSDSRGSNVVTNKPNAQSTPISAETSSMYVGKKIYLSISEGSIIIFFKLMEFQVFASQRR
jgi:hypothetical protein